MGEQLTIEWEDISSGIAIYDFQRNAIVKLQLPTLLQAIAFAASMVVFGVGGHFAARAVIGEQQSRQLTELAETALRRSEAAVGYGTATLDDLIMRGLVTCDPASLQAVRLQVYQSSAVKDIRLVNRDGTVICSAYSETLEFDSGWAERPDMLPSQDQGVLLFRVDQVNGSALGVLRDIDTKKSLVAIMGINSNLFDIMPAELRGHSQVLLELNTGLEVGQFSQKPKNEFAETVRFIHSSNQHPILATVVVERSILAHWNNEPYWPTLLISEILGMVFGLLIARATEKLEGPVADIQRGLERQEFRPYYQPTFDLRTCDIRGCEVLARWVRVDGRIVPPLSFIPLAESTGQIEPMTWQILATALRELQPRLRDDKYFKLSVNIVPRHLVSDGFVDTLRRVVADARISARQIVLEVTERTEFPNLENAAAAVKHLRELGFRVAMDDVGVGHSGLSQIKALGANTIKIDKFFVDTITQDEAASTIIGMLVRLARDLGMTVIAEGIETEDQMQALLACGVEEGQGYLVSPPLPFSKFDEFLDRHRSRALIEDAVKAARVA